MSWELVGCCRFLFPKKTHFGRSEKRVCNLGKLRFWGFFFGGKTIDALFWFGQRWRGVVFFSGKAPIKSWDATPQKKTQDERKLKVFSQFWIGNVWVEFELYDKNMIFFPSASRWLNRIVSSLSKMTPGGNLEDHVTCVIYCRRLEVSQIFLKSSVAG